eukprot:5645346-Amphidinium_carterae.1
MHTQELGGQANVRIWKCDNFDTLGQCCANQMQSLIKRCRCLQQHKRSIEDSTLDSTAANLGL